MCVVVMLALFVLSSLPAKADEVIAFTGGTEGTATYTYNMFNTPAIYFTAPASKIGASKLHLKSIQLYTFLDGTGSYTNLQNQTVYLGVGTSKPNSSLTIGGTGASHTISNGQIIGFSAGVTYNSEGYTTFNFTEGLEITPGQEYVLYMTKNNSVTFNFTCYNIRMRVYQDESNTTTNYFGQSGNHMKWMPFYIVTLTDVEEEVHVSLPNPSMTEEEIQADMEASSESGSTGTTSTFFLKGFGFTMPNGNGVSSYQTNQVEVYVAYNFSTRNNKYHLVIAKSNLADASIAANEIIAVSTNTVQVTSGNFGYKTFNFGQTLKFRPNTTYYAYFTTSTNAATNGFTSTGCPVQVISTTYQPTTYSSTSYTGTYAVTNARRPAFRMQLTKKTDSDPYVDGELQTLWSSFNNAHPWRIPALARTRKGTLVAFGGWLICDKDVGNGECHIASKTSIDNGVTWSKAGAAVATGSGTPGAFDCGYGDAAVVADRESDRILVMCASGNVGYPNSTRSKPIRVARIYGTDSPSGNITWGSPSDVTASVYGVNTSMQGLFFASGRILQSRAVKVGDYYRLYSALLYHTGSGVHHNIVVYSDDFGETWNQLGTTDAIASGANEAKVEEMPNGDIFISSRKASGRYFNLFKFTDLKTATGSWGTTQTLSLGSGDSCNGEILFVNVKKADDTNCILALQSMPSVAKTTNYPRKKVRIYWREVSQEADLSTIANWTSGWSGNNSYLVSCSGSAYSTMIVTPDDKIGFMLENNYYDVDAKPRCDLQYVNLPISTITNGAYTDIISEFVLPRESYTTTVGRNKTTMRFDRVKTDRSDIAGGDRRYTLCLPYDMTAEEIEASGITSVETLRDYHPEQNLVRFVNASGDDDQSIAAIETGKPYIVQGNVPNGLVVKNQLIEKTAPTLTSVEKDGAVFKGNFTEPYDISLEGNAYGYRSSDGKFAKAKDGSKLHAYCAFILLPAAAGDVKAIDVNFNDDADEIPTAVGELPTEDTLAKNVPMYNLNGQRVQAGYKGIVIMNGKKNFIK